MHWVRHMKRSASEQSRSKVVPKLKFLARLVRKKGETVPNTKFVVLGSSHEKFGVSTSPLNPEIKRHNRQCWTAVSTTNSMWGRGLSYGSFTGLLQKSIILLTLPSCAVALAFFCPQPLLPFGCLS